MLRFKPCLIYPTLLTGNGPCFLLFPEPYMGIVLETAGICRTKLWQGDVLPTQSYEQLAIWCCRWTITSSCFNLLTNPVV